MRPLAADAIVDTIFAMFDRYGQTHYGEAVTQLDHALQCAHHARASGDSDALVAAALLHDIGHLLQKQGEDAADRGIDARHERIGAAWLEQEFGPPIAEPVRLHVAAKRYLATREPGYLESLSAASLRSLGLQGGPMSDTEAEAFSASPGFDDAIRLRRYDELGKVEGVTIAPLTEYRALLTALATQNEATTSPPQTTS